MYAFSRKNHWPKLIDIKYLLIRERMVLVKFLNDTMVRPLESQWFQYYTPNQNEEIQEFSKSNAVVSHG